MISLQKTLIVIVTASLLAGCRNENTDGIKLSKTELGNKWPLSVESGIATCINPEKFAIFIANDGKTYAVNGFAKTMAVQKGWLNIDEIWLDDPSDPKYKINISPILDASMSKCGP